MIHTLWRSFLADIGLPDFRWTRTHIAEFAIWLSAFALACLLIGGAR